MLYQWEHYGGWIWGIPESDGSNVPGSKNDMVSSIKVEDGCTFNAYMAYGQVGLMHTITNDMYSLGIYNDQLSSYSCKCNNDDDDTLGESFSLSYSHRHTCIHMIL